MPQITPIAGPMRVEGAVANMQVAADARARAIAKLTGGGEPTQAQETPVKNPSQIAPEEMSAVKASESTGQSSTVDGSQEPPKEATAPEEAPLSSQYAQLARKEKAVRAKVNELRAQEAAVKAREEAIKAKEAEMQSDYVPKSMIKKDAYKVLQDQGYTQEQIANMLLNAPDPAAQQQQAVIDELRAEIQALKEGQEASKKSFEENQTNSYKQAVNQIRNEARQLVDADPTYETIKATGSLEDVVELITKTFDKDGVILSVEEAASAVEDYLVEEAIKIAKLNKIQQRLKPASAPAPQKSQAANNQQAGRTLTSTMGTSRPLTAKERAILAFKGELKS